MKKEKSLVDKAYNMVKQKIITLQFEPGMKLEEKELMVSTGVGRTPVREAIKLLVSDGLIVNHGMNANFVRDLTLKNSKDLTSLLYHLGDTIFNLVSPNGDFTPIINQLTIINKKVNKALDKRNYFDFVILNSEFHKSLARVADNPYLDAFVEKCYNEAVRIDFTTSLVTFEETEREEYYSIIRSQHQQFIELLTLNKFNDLKELYRNHLRIGQTRIINYFAQSIK